MATERTELEERTLVLAPTGRDGRVLGEILQKAGIPVFRCADFEELCRELRQGAGAAVLAEEALTPSATASLAGVLREQAPWSDVPIVISTGEGETTDARVRTVASLDSAGNVTILERPVRVLTMVTTIHAALRARRRQYVMRDLLVAQEAQMAELRAEREMRERLVSLLAHDLRGPLAAAKLGAQALALRPERLDQRRDLAIRIDRSIERTDNMIRDLLDASRLQAGQRMPLRLDGADLAAIAEVVAEELNQVSGERVQVEVSGKVRGIWSAEELRRALWNLASNGIKYGLPGRPVRIEIKSGDGFAAVAVHNEGNPISAEEQAHLFEPFARSASADASGHGGWGLGLALVRGCAEAHGGSVDVRSDAETGTTFTMKIPLDARPYQPG